MRSLGGGYRLTGLSQAFHSSHMSGKRGEPAEDELVMAGFPGQCLTREPVPACLMDVIDPADV